jgi:signal transduction histidine kinase
VTRAVDIDRDWAGRLVRILVLFRLLVLLVTVAAIGPHPDTSVVAVAVIAAALLSYAPLRHWDRISPSISRHPMYMVVELAVSTLILAATGAHGPFFYFTLGTATLTGIIYGVQGIAVFSPALIALYEVVALTGLPHLHPLTGLGSLVLVPLLYPIAAGAGVAARRVIDRGAATEELLRRRTQALSAEQERLGMARELHDSLAKTVEGIALTATALQRRCAQNPAAAAELARMLADDARQAALEARELMADLRGGQPVELIPALRERAGVLSERCGTVATVECPRPGAIDSVAPELVRELTRIFGEAVINAVTHADARRVTARVDVDAGVLTMIVFDDGRGIAAEPDWEALALTGHFGLIGMRERAQSLAGQLTVAPGANGGTEVRVVIPLSPLSTNPLSELTTVAAHGNGNGAGRSPDDTDLLTGWRP